MNLKTVRSVLSMSVSELAEALNVSPVTVRNIEAGRSMLSAELSRRLGLMLGWAISVPERPTFAPLRRPYRRAGGAG